MKVHHDKQAFRGARILAGRDWLHDHSIVVENGRFASILPTSELPSDIPCRDLQGGQLVAGFVDIQVNGGGDVLLNDAPTAQSVKTIAEAHRQFGTTSILPTLISEDPAIIECALTAVSEAIADGVPGVVGIHIEGPYLNPGKAGIHDSGKFRLLDETAIQLLTGLQNGKTMITLAPELCPPQTIAQLIDRGAIVVAGHTLADIEVMQRAFEAGMTGVTHLFNAMSQLEARSPGVVGAALLDPRCVCGLIVDGRHVHPACMKLAFKLKGPDGIALVTDAMSTVGGIKETFVFNGVEIKREGASCVAPDGTLAGSNLDMATAVRLAVHLIGVSLSDACTMASATPARMIGLDHEIGRIAPGLRADFVHLDHDLQVTETWIAGMPADMLA